LITTIFYIFKMVKNENKNFVKHLKIISIITIILSILSIVVGWFWNKNKSILPENDVNLSIQNDNLKNDLKDDLNI